MNSALSAEPPTEISWPMSVLRAVHHAVERGRDALERFQGHQAVEVGLGRVDRRAAGGEVAGLLVGFLARDGVLGDQAVPPLGRDRRQALVGLGGGEAGPGLHDLLVEVGGVDLGQDLAGLHRRADVGVPALEVAAGPGVDRGGVEGLDVAGQDQVGVAAARHLGQADGRDGLVAGPGPQRLVGVDAGGDAGGHHDGGHDQGGGSGQLQAARGDGAFGGDVMIRHGKLR